MSQQATLSPSPIQFRDPSSNIIPPRPAPSNNSIAPAFLERRRTSHPHNHLFQLHSSHRASEEMADRSQSQHRPRLEHRTSQTIIDLTDEPEDTPSVPSNNAERARSQRPPQLGRSDASGFQFIDLTEDNGEPDIIITGGREIPARRPHAPRPAPPRREESPSLFVPDAPAPRSIHQIRHLVPARLGNAIGMAFGFARGGREMSNQQHADFHAAILQMGGGDDNFFQAPIAMDYARNAFAEARKPDHVPPKPAREHFTRSPKEDDLIICPSCEEELVHNKEVEAVTKKGRGAPTRKDMEEHPFWVVKECGHVYCNNCYQHRGLPGKTPGNVTFRETSKEPKSGKSSARPSKVLTCSVEDCESDVKSKDKWVGVFL
ncbi:hypothetical protein B0J14DRAFT_578588 [Halenospora varia]|nr:hypothetical protein B0J14DRAFT_578588 [Halenospora varia]